MLTDSSTVRFRAINQDDVERLLDFFYRLSRHSVYLRFHHTMTHLSREEAERFCTIDYQNSFALVATITEDSKEKIIASGRYYRLPASDKAEVGFTVEDKYQEKGHRHPFAEATSRYSQRAWHPPLHSRCARRKP